MSNASTPYEIRRDILNRAIDIVNQQYNMAYQTALTNLQAVNNTIHDLWDLDKAKFKEAKKALDDANKKYENVIDEALKLAAKMNEFVSSKV